MPLDIDTKGNPKVIGIQTAARDPEKTKPISSDCQSHL